MNLVPLSDLLLHKEHSVVPGGHHLYTDLVSKGLHQLGHLVHKTRQLLLSVIKLSKDIKKKQFFFSVQDQPTSICMDLFLIQLTKILKLIKYTKTARMHFLTKLYIPGLNYFISLSE